MKQDMQKLPEQKRKSWARRIVVGGVVVIGLLAVVLWMTSGQKKTAETATAAVKRGALDITVLEGGSVQALESQEIKCEVRVGYQGTKILKIIDEGYQVTEEDVRTNKVLVELDSTDLEKQIVQQEIQFQSAAASLTDAQQNYDIQLNQNISDTQAAEQKARFARMDFDKFLGDTVSTKIIASLGIEKMIAAEESKAKELTAAAAKVPSTGAKGTNGLVAVQLPKSGDKTITNAVATEPAKAVPTLQVVDFSKYAKLEALGDGEAKQKLRKCEDDLQSAQKEFGQATSTLDGTKRLFAKGFVTRTDLDRDDIAHENARLKVQTAETARDLFLRYEFPRTSEEDLSKYSEAVRELDRARKAAVSKLAQADAKLKSAQGQYNVQSRQRQDLQDQLDKCVIHAKKAGLVVYGSGREQFYYGGEEQVREGATVRERQSIITIPDMTKMGVNVRIHESYIKKIKKGEKVRITLDAFPDQILDGDVTKVGVLPDSQNMWMNPDMKVYLTTISIPKTFDWLKPGMSAKVEIFVDHLSDVVYAPIQAITPGEGKQLCYVMNHGKTEKREVEVGQFNDSFIEIKSGLHEGDLVLLHPPETAEPGAADKKAKDVKPAEPMKAPAVKTGKA